MIRIHLEQHKNHYFYVWLGNELYFIFINLYENRLNLRIQLNLLKKFEQIQIVQCVLWGWAEAYSL